MKNEEIIDKLNELHSQSFSLEDLNSQIQSAKEDSVKTGNEEQAKLLWIYQRIIEIHSLYVNAFNLLKCKNYYKGWCQLEKIEITFKNLKKHFSFNKTIYHLWDIEKSVKNLQVLFPYRLFASSELLKKKKNVVSAIKKLQLEILVVILSEKFIMVKCVIVL